MNNVLGQSAFWIINKKLALEIGFEGSVLLADLISKQDYFSKRGELTEDEFFFNTSANILKDTGISYRHQKSILSKLSDMNLVVVCLMGVPAKLHFHVNEDEALKLLGLKNTDDPYYAFVKPVKSEKELKHTYADGFTTKEELTKAVDTVYKAYPTKCAVRGASTSKGTSNRGKIEKLLRDTKELYLIATINWYANDCALNNVYMKSFTTFLNNLPDLPDGTTEGEISKGKIKIGEISKLVKWLSKNYMVKYADEKSNKAAKQLIKLGYKNKDFLNRFLLKNKER